MVVPDPRTSMYVSIGLIVASWSHVEQTLDFWVTIVFRNCGGKSIAYRNQLPRALNNKITFLEDSFNKLEILHPYKYEGLAFLNRIKLLSDMRHTLVHGAIEELTPETLKIAQLKYGKEKHEVRHHKYTVTELFNCGNKIQDLVIELTPYIHRLMDQFLH
ncbi:MAG: hypothetical protein WC600_03645 [Desulfobaccales bacterium]